MGVRVILRWLLQELGREDSKALDADAFRKVISIDVSCPEFNDFYPTELIKSSIAAGFDIEKTPNGSTIRTRAST